MNEAEAILLAEEEFSDWAALAFVRNGTPLPEGYLESKGNEILERKGKYDSASELSLTIMAYSAAGGKAYQVAGINLLQKLVNRTDMEDEGSYGVSLAYLAYLFYSTNNYYRPLWYSDLFFNRLNESRLANGSWPSSGDRFDEVATTLMAVSALKASYDIPKAYDAEKIAAWLKTLLEDNGSINQSTAATANAIMLLSTLEVDTADFHLTDGDNPLRFIMSNRLSEGGFSEKLGGKLDPNATLQAYLALTNYKLYLEGKPGVLSGWKHSDPKKVTVRVEGPKGTIARGSSKGVTAHDAVKSFLESENIAYAMSKDRFVSVKGIKERQYGGDEAWRFAVEANAYYDFQPECSYGEKILNDGDLIILYYGPSNMPCNVGIETNSIPHHTPMIMHVKKPVITTEGVSTGNASFLTVHIDDKKYVTDAEGKGEIGGLKTGAYDFIFTGYQAGGLPTILKTIIQVRVFSTLDEYKDREEVSNWAKDEMASAINDGYMQGINSAGNLLAPKKGLTRAEFVAMLLRVRNETTSTEQSRVFTDVPAKKWYSDAVNKAAELGITDRVRGEFEPNRNITREEAAIMLAKAGALDTYGTLDRLNLADIKDLPDNSLKAIQAVNEHRIMMGSKGEFNPKETLIREQAAAVLARLEIFLYRDKIFSYYDYFK